MTELEFKESIDRLKGYLKVSLDKEDYETYFRRFYRMPKSTFDQVIDHLMDTHERRTFPLIAEFAAAVRDVMIKRSEATADELDHVLCHDCWGEGRVIEPDGGQGQERFCHCAAGDKARAGRRLYIKAHGRGFYSMPRPIRKALPMPEPLEDEDETIPF